MGCPALGGDTGPSWEVWGEWSVVQMEESIPQTALTSKQCRECCPSPHPGVIDAEEIKASLRKIGLCVSDSEVHKLLQK